MPDERRKAIFIDRDGTLVEEVNYLSRVEDLRLFPFTVDAVRRLKAAGFLLIVVTNQSGIGRGIFEEGAMHEIHRAIQQQLSNAVDAFYFCPHLPCDGCRCRKPGLGMIERAMSDFSIDIENSWMIGDKKIDVETGINAGSKNCNGQNWLRGGTFRAALIRAFVACQRSVGSCARHNQPNGRAR